MAASFGRGHPAHFPPRERDGMTQADEPAQAAPESPAPASAAPAGAAPASESAAADDQVLVFRPPNTLRKKIEAASGGETPETLIAQAQTYLDFMRPRCLNQISDLLGDIQDAYGRSQRQGDEPFEPLYALSAKIIDQCAPIPEYEIDRAATSLCELVDRCEGQGKWDWPAVDVHLDALVLLRQDAGELEPEARERIFRGLARVTERLPKAEGR